MLRRLIMPVVVVAAVLFTAASAQSFNATIRGNAAFTAVQERGIVAPWALGLGLGAGLPGLPLEIRATADWYLAGPAFLVSANVLYTVLPLQVVNVYAMGGLSALFNPDFAPTTSELFLNLGGGARVNLGPAFIFGELALYVNGALQVYGAPFTLTVGAGLNF
jgi:hypothetical protein